MKRHLIGFTLIELLVSLVITSFVMLGTTYTYMMTSDVVYSTKNTHNAQEVLRYSLEVFSRSLKQTKSIPENPEPTTLVVEQAQEGATACDGTKPPGAFKETYRLDGKNLVCQIDTGEDIVMLMGVADIQYSVGNNIVQILVTPENWMRESLPAGFRIDIALTSRIFSEALGG